MAIEQKTIDELKAKHGEIHLLAVGDVQVIVRRPGRAQWKRFRVLTTDEKRRPDALETLFRDCLLHPAATDIEATLDQYPAVGETFGAQLVELAGLSEKVEKKVL